MAYIPPDTPLWRENEDHHTEASNTSEYILYGNCPEMADLVKALGLPETTFQLTLNSSKDGLTQANADFYVTGEMYSKIGETLKEKKPKGRLPRMLDK